MKQLAIFFLILLTLCSCATRSEKLAKRGLLIPKPDQIYTAIGNNRNPQLALEIALSTAEQCCLRQQKNYVVLGTNTKADPGLVTEKTASAIDAGVAVVAAAGTALPSANILRGNKSAEITFRCE